MDFLVWCSSQDVFEEEKVPHEAALMERLEKVQESVGTKSRVDAQQGSAPLHTCGRLRILQGWMWDRHEVPDGQEESYDAF